MEDELFDTLYRVVRHEATLRPRRKRVRFSDAVILLVAFWAVLHARPVRRGYATGGTCKGYKLFCCWGKAPLLPEAVVLAGLDRSDQAGGIELIDRLDRLHEGAACGYLLADSTHDTNPLHAYAGAHGMQ